MFMLLSTRLPPLVATNIISLGDVSIHTNPYAALAVSTNDRRPGEQRGCTYKSRYESRERSSPRRGGIVGACPGGPGRQRARREDEADDDDAGGGGAVGGALGGRGPCIHLRGHLWQRPARGHERWR